MQWWQLSAAYRGFAAIRDQWRHIIAAQIERETGTQIGKTENHMKYQIWKSISIIDESQKPNGKKQQCSPLF